MKRAEIQQPRAPLTIQQHSEIPAAPTGGIVVKTQYCGICHSDVHLWNFAVDVDNPAVPPNTPLRMKFPVVLGHEISGTVYSLGEGEDADAEDLKVGDKVVVYPWLGCGTCQDCKSGETNLCTYGRNDIGCGADGGYGEFVVVSRKHYITKVPDSIPMDVAAMLPCSGLTTYNAVTKVQPTIEKATKRKGSASLLVIGAGGLGLWCLQSAKVLLLKGTRIVSADVDVSKLDVAMNHGADDKILWNIPTKEDDVEEEQLLKRTKEKGGGGFDGVIDLVNSSVTAKRGLKCLNKGGAMILIGLYGGTLTLPLVSYVARMSTIIGSYTGTMNQLRELIKLTAREKLKPPPITHCALEDVQQVLEKLTRGEMLGMFSSSQTTMEPARPSPTVTD